MAVCTSTPPKNENSMSASSNRIKSVLAPVVLACSLAVCYPALASAETTGEGRPAVKLGPVEGSGATTTLTGTVNPEGPATTYYFQYGAREKYGSQTPPPAKPLEGFTTTRVSAPAPGLERGDVYRLVATNKYGTRYSKPHEYTGASVSPGKGTPKTKKSAFVLPTSFQPALVGAGFTFSGTLTGPENGGREVVLQASPYPYTDAFSAVAGPIRTSASGAFSFQIASLHESTRFRVATASGVLLYSDSVTELAEVHVTLKVQTSKSVKGLVRLYGTVSPAATGATVFVQLEKQRKPQQKAEHPEKGAHSERAEELEEKPLFGDRFKGFVKHATRSFSRFSLIVRVHESGSYRAYVQMPPGPYASAGSATVALKAPAGKKKT